MIASVTPIVEQAGDTWRATLSELGLNRGHVFQVYTRLELPDEISHDYYDAATIELGRAVYERALACLRANRRPDLHVIAEDLKRRDGGLIGRRRTADGAVLLGDTPPDEQQR